MELNIDPNTCTKEELESAIKECEKNEHFYDNAQLSTKIAINSIYGVFGTEYYSLCSTAIAESITLQGQDLIKHSVAKIDEYFRNVWPSDEAAHRRVADYMKSKFPDFDTERFMELTKQHVEIGETSEIYGDSVSGDSMILLNGKTVAIEELFNSGYNLTTNFGKEYVCVDELAATFNNGVIKTLPIKYVMRHKVRKGKWNVRTSNGHSVTVTEDHSIMIVNDDVVNPVEVSPKNIVNGDRIITTDGCDTVITTVESCECVGNFDSEYVYDIEINTDDEYSHNFFANDILVHNTDSIHSSSIIRTEKHPDGIPISELYDENSNKPGPTTKKGHESVFMDDKALNCVGVNSVFSDVKRLIRHKVNKDSWTIISESGKSIRCTDNHSIMVFRNGCVLSVKPSEITKTDSLVTNNGSVVKLESVMSCCKDESKFVDEYVYDIEMDDDTHTFVANDILVHNSAYLTVQPFVLAYQIPLEQQITFDLAINECVLTSYLDGVFDDYAKKFNCPENKEKFELEKIARTVIMQAKKKYVMDIGYAEPGVFHAPLHKVTIKGLEAIQGSVPEFCRKQIREFIDFVLLGLSKGNKPSYDEIIGKMKEIKTKFSMQSPNDVCKSFKMTDYEKYILDDKGSQIRFNEVTKINIHGDTVVTDITVPIHVRGAAIYNNMLYNKASKYKSKYNTIKKGDKVRYYYASNCDVFSFLIDQFPAEFAPKMDANAQFEKMMLDPLNRIVESLGYAPVPCSLTYSAGLW